jgi:hypothetical protein
METPNALYVGTEGCSITSVDAVSHGDPATGIDTDVHHVGGFVFGKVELICPQIQATRK